MSKYKLVYFNARGWAELSRLIFAYSGIPYEDFRFEREDWPTYKAESPLGQAPWLEVNGQKLPQSKAVARYLAKVANLTGVNDIEAAKCDAIVDFIMDLIEPLKVIVKVKQENPEALEDECKKHIGKLSEQILSLEKFIAGNGGEYAVGNQITWADLFLFNFIHDLMVHAPQLYDFSLAPTAKKISDRVANIPAIKDWLAKRPVTQM